ncbi:hypothetical protein FQN49_005685 [Arthroderma sp. PD_2]|nr:hypothetical protein FQN49_005685 [Arthroderma sp. PD_2]
MRCQPGEISVPITADDYNDRVAAAIGKNPPTDRPSKGSGHSNSSHRGTTLRKIGIMYAIAAIQFLGILAI